MTEQINVPMIAVRGLGKSFGEMRALADIDLDVHRGEVVTLIGPSGSGKTTLLRCMNFLESYDEGEVLIHGALLGYRQSQDGKRTRDTERGIAEVRSRLAMVFQHSVEPREALGLDRFGDLILVSGGGRAGAT